MPKVEAYKATVEVTGTQYVDAESVEIYRLTKDVFAETYGVMFDRLVLASIEVASETRRWLTKYRPGTKVLGKDGTHWMVSVSYPDAFNSFPDESDVGAGSAIASTKEIVQSVAHYRHLALSNVLSDIEIARQTKNARPYREIVPESMKDSFRSTYSLRSFDNILDYGIPSAWFEEQFAEAEEDGTVALWRRQRQTSRAAFEWNRKRRVAVEAVKDTAKKTKRWWMF